MKVLFDARLVLEKPTGIGQYIASLVPEMLAAAPAVEFHLLRRSDPWAGYELDQWEAPNLIQHISGEAHMSLRQQVTVPRLARKVGADLVHYPHFDAPVLFGSVPVVVTLHDAKYLVRPDFFDGLGWLKKQYMRLAFAQSLRRAAAVITVSKSTARSMVGLFGVPLKRMDVIHEAADQRFRPAPIAAREAFRQHYGLTRPFILTVGERRPHKNQAGLIRAFARSASRDTFDLVIVGQPYSGYSEPEATAVQLGVSKRVHFLSHVSVEELVAAYSAATLFVLVSFYEGFGLPLLEAMACETPVLASATTGAAEVVDDAGVTVDPEDEAAVAALLDQLLTDVGLRAELVAAGKERAADFSWRRAAQETLAVYQRVQANAEK